MNGMIMHHVSDGTKELSFQWLSEWISSMASWHIDGV